MVGLVTEGSCQVISRKLARSIRAAIYLLAGRYNCGHQVPLNAWVCPLFRGYYPRPKVHHHKLSIDRRAVINREKAVVSSMKEVRSMKMGGLVLRSSVEAVVSAFRKV